MIVRFGGGNSGIASYLENGMKQGRMFSRDELDQRVVLEGDLALTHKIIESIQDKGQERYLHITLSFKENELSNELLQDVVSDYRELLMTAYSDDEFNFYAEAHLPKIKSIKDERTGEMIERKPHIHIVIPEVNLLSLNKLSPVGLVDKYERYLDSIQEFINNKYNLETPKENIRNTDMHHANVLSRIKGDFFGEKQQAMKSQLVDEIAQGKINTLDEFQQRLSDFGEVKIRNAGKPTQYFAVKIGDDKKFTNLNHAAFKTDFIQNKILPYVKPSIDEINANIQEWKDRVSREIKHVNFATQSFRKQYAEASPSEKARLLADRELNYERKYRGSQNNDIRASGRARNHQLNADRSQRRQSSLATRETSSLSGLPRSNVVYRENQRSRGAKSVLPTNEYVDLRNGKPRNNSALRWNDRGRTGTNGTRRIISQGLKPYGLNRSFKSLDKGIPKQRFHRNIFDKNIAERPISTAFERYQAKQANVSKNEQKFSQSNALAQQLKNFQTEQEYKAELAKFAEIRKNIDPKAFLMHLQQVYAIDPEQYGVSYAKDGRPRFKVDKRNLNASDFLTKHLNLEWNEAKTVLSYVYERQANKSVNQETLSNLELQRNIKSFTYEVRQFEKDFKLALHNMNVDNRNAYRQEKKRIYSRISNYKVRNQELTIASFRAMQRQERIDEFEQSILKAIEKAKIDFQQGGYSQKALEESTMGFKDAFNVALGNSEFGSISASNEQISFAENYKKQQILLKRQLQEQQKTQEAEAAKSSGTDKSTQQAFHSPTAQETLKKNDLGISKKENGDIEYKRLSDGKTVFTDTGKQMFIPKDMQSQENVKAFLELAIDRYGNDLKINGSKEFKDMVVETAAANNLPIILQPAKLQQQLIARRKELTEELHADSITNEAGERLQQPQAEANVPEHAQPKKEVEQPQPQAEAKAKAPEQTKPEEESEQLQAEIKTPEQLGKYDFYQIANLIERKGNDEDYLDKYKISVPDIDDKNQYVKGFEEARESYIIDKLNEIKTHLDRGENYEAAIKWSDFRDFEDVTLSMPAREYDNFESVLNKYESQTGINYTKLEKDASDNLSNYGGVWAAKRDLREYEYLNDNKLLAIKENDQDSIASYDKQIFKLKNTIMDNMSNSNYAESYHNQVMKYPDRDISSENIAELANRYDIKFTYRPKEKSYAISVNGKPASEVIAKQHKVLDVIKNHPDMRKHNVPENEIAKGLITRTDSMKGAGNRPKNMALDSKGQEIKQVKAKDNSLKR
ncbi:LPD7 domain-containing protein [Lonepinella sp. BR2882]|uniref:LPD7 domain-containing protein n=1 Tax=Lonepinella sp. BR2882 TaxID=3095283 RepID=UPI003F6DA966